MKLIIISTILLLLQGCFSDSEADYGDGYRDGYRAGYNTTCNIRITNQIDWGSEDYIRGYRAGYVDGISECRPPTIN